MWPTGPGADALGEVSARGAKAHAALQGGGSIEAAGGGTRNAPNRSAHARARVARARSKGCSARRAVARLVLGVGHARQRRLVPSLRHLAHVRASVWECGQHLEAFNLQGVNSRPIVFEIDQ